MVDIFQPRSLSASDTEGVVTITR